MVNSKCLNKNGRLIVFIGTFWIVQIKQSDISEGDFFPFRHDRKGTYLGKWHVNPYTIQKGSLNSSYV